MGKEKEKTPGEQGHNWKLGQVGHLPQLSVTPGAADRYGESVRAVSKLPWSPFLPTSNDNLKKKNRWGNRRRRHQEKRWPFLADGMRASLRFYSLGTLGSQPWSCYQQLKLRCLPPTPHPILTSKSGDSTLVFEHATINLSPHELSTSHTFFC